MGNEKLYVYLQNLGLTQYEAKTYIALLIIGTSNAYKISKKAEIPRTRVYDILDSLAQKGVVMLEETNDGSKIFTALPANVFLEQSRHKWVENYRRSKEALENLEIQDKQNSYVSMVKGQDNILAFCRLLLGRAKKRVLISIWDSMYEKLLPELQACIERNCQVRGITFNVKTPLRNLSQYKLSKGLSKHKLNQYLLSADAKKWFIISVDSSELLYGDDSAISTKAFYTTDPVHNYLLEAYIFHDVLINKLFARTSQKEMDAWIIPQIKEFWGE